MGREIKFRIFEPLNKKMHYLDFALYKHNNFTQQNYWVLPVGRQCSGRDYTYMNLDAVNKMQYTGFKDKNNKEIYEGDIVEAHGFMRAEIVFECGCFKFRWLDKKTKSIRYKIETMFENTSLIFEVIGNKYENTELLEGEE